MCTVELALKGVTFALASTVKGSWYTASSVHWPDGYPMLMSPNEGETTAHCCYCRGDIVVRMRKVLAIRWSWYACFWRAWVLIIGVFHFWVWLNLQYNRTVPVPPHRTPQTNEFEGCYLTLLLLSKKDRSRRRPLWVPAACLTNDIRELNAEFREANNPNILKKWTLCSAYKSGSSLMTPVHKKTNPKQSSTYNW